MPPDAAACLRVLASKAKEGKEEGEERQPLLAHPSIWCTYTQIHVNHVDFFLQTIGQIVCTWARVIPERIQVTQLIPKQLLKKDH